MIRVRAKARGIEISDKPSSDIYSEAIETSIYAANSFINIAVNIFSLSKKLCGICLLAILYANIKRRKEERTAQSRSGAFPKNSEPTVIAMPLDITVAAPIVV